MTTAVHELGEDVAKAAAAPLWPLSDDELTGWLRAARRIEQAAVVLQARLVRHASRRGVPTSHGYKNAAAWIRSMLPLDIGPSRDLAEGAAALGRWPQVEQAVLDGRMGWRQARVIAAAVEKIPAELVEVDALIRAGSEADLRGGDGPGPEAAAVGQLSKNVTADGRPADGLFPDGGASGGDHIGGLQTVEAGVVASRAEQTLIEMAERLNAAQLTRIGERILSHVAPELAERAEQAWLARQEARAHLGRTLSWSAPVDGMVRLTGVLGVEDAATVRAALHPLCTPAPADDRTPGQRRADALIDVCRLALRAGELPDQGSQPAQLSVTVPYDPLTQALGVGTTDTGDPLSAEAVRRLACDARILPYVLGGAGQILDVGRARRLATAQLRRALAVRDRGCAFPDCDRPAGWGGGHHMNIWASPRGTELGRPGSLLREPRGHGRPTRRVGEVAPQGPPRVVPRCGRPPVPVVTPELSSCPPGQSADGAHRAGSACTSVLP